MEYKRFEVYFVNLDPTIGSEIKKTRPCVIISPDEMNRNINTLIVAPITSKLRKYPTRIGCKIEGKQGQIVLDQIRTVDKIRLIKKVDKLNKKIEEYVIKILAEMFSR